MVDILLRQWREYMESSQYVEERERARPNRTDEKKQIEVNAKVKVHRKLEEGKIREVLVSHQDLYARFLDGRLDAEIDEATNSHGYGTLSTGQRIGAFGPRFR